MGGGDDVLLPGVVGGLEGGVVIEPAVEGHAADARGLGGVDVGLAGGEADDRLALLSGEVKRIRFGDGDDGDGVDGGVGGWIGLGDDVGIGDC